MKKFFFFIFIFPFFLTFFFISSTPIQANDNWWNTSWQWRKKVTFQNSTQNENLTNFPVMVKLTSTNFDFSRTNSSGNDIRFIDTDGSTQLSYEVEKWDSSGREAIIWVKIPQIDGHSNADYMHMYYGNSNATDAQAASSVWNTGFTGVWHLKEDPSGLSPQVLDSSGNGYHGSVSGSMTSSQQVLGKIDGSLDFDGVNDYISTTYSQNEPSQFTVEAWVYPTQTTINSSIKGIVDRRGGGCGNMWRLVLLSGVPSFGVWDSLANFSQVSAPTALQPNTWYHVASVFDNGVITLYVNGVAVASGSGPSTINACSHVLRIAEDCGAGCGFSRYFSGKIDEVRHSRNVRSANAIAADYRSGNDNFLNYEVDQSLSASSFISINNSTESMPEGKLRATGSVSIAQFFTFTNVQYRINKGGWESARANDGSFNSSTEPFYFDFDPKQNNSSSEGYVTQVRAVKSNGDILTGATFFAPFRLNSPVSNASTKSQYPSFSFSVNKQRDLLYEGLQKYAVMVKRENEDWRTYIDEVPVSYDYAKDDSDNTAEKSTTTSGNGIYEDKKIHVEYSEDGTRLEVYAKAIDEQFNSSEKYWDEGGKRLRGGIYQWKVQAVDKAGRVQETETRYLHVRGSGGAMSSWFPLQIEQMTGYKSVLLTTNNDLSVAKTYTTNSDKPAFGGTAFSGAKVTLQLTELNCTQNCEKSFETSVNNNSKWSLTLPSGTIKIGKKYSTHFFVSLNNKYNELPTFTLSRKL